MYPPILENVFSKARASLRSPAPWLAPRPAFPRATLLLVSAPTSPNEMEAALEAEEREAFELAQSGENHTAEDQGIAEAYVGGRRQVPNDEDDDDGVLRQDIAVLPEETNGVSLEVDRAIRNDDPSV